MSARERAHDPAVTSRADARDSYMAYNQFCLRICISENSTYSAANECQHTLDEMGCQWVMPGE